MQKEREREVMKNRERNKKKGERAKFFPCFDLIFNLSHFFKVSPKVAVSVAL